MFQRDIIVVFAVALGANSKWQKINPDSNGIRRKIENLWVCQSSVAACVELNSIPIGDKNLNPTMRDIVRYEARWFMSIRNIDLAHMLSSLLEIHWKHFCCAKTHSTDALWDARDKLIFARTLSWIINHDFLY